MDDPTIYVLNKITEVLTELRVEVGRYNIFEEKNVIATLPATLQEADGVILAATVEWFGMGGYMMQFLDMCWLYADKQELSGKYMLPVVMATTYGERDVESNLVKAWETLGGNPLAGLVAYVENLDEFEKNEDYRSLIEKKAEALYRSVHQKIQSLPNSNFAVRTNLLKTRTIELTPQEMEQLSKFVSDETYVKQQKEDIEELSAMFRKMLSGQNQDGDSNESDASENEQTSDGAGDDASEENTRNKNTQTLISYFIKHYRPEPDFKASYAIIVSDKNVILHIEATPEAVKVFYADTEEADVILRTTSKILVNILSGRNTFQKGFMAGEISAKGNFKTLRMLDTIFQF